MTSMTSEIMVHSCKAQLHNRQCWLAMNAHLVLMLVYTLYLLTYCLLEDCKGWFPAIPGHQQEQIPTRFL